MKKILYDNWIARTFLWGDYDTITLAAWVCTKYKNKEEMPQRIRNHECTHARQWVECMIVSGVIIWALVIFSGISSWWFCISFLMFYALYVLEYLVKLMFFGREAYNRISFEKEAYENQYDDNYLENAGYFGRIRYLFN
jgi:hypothetical protein